jgi:hypothetical protein
MAVAPPEPESFDLRLQVDLLESQKSYFSLLCDNKVKQNVPIATTDASIQL